MHRRFTAIVVVAALAVLGLTACADDGGGTAEDDYGPQEGLEVGTQAPEARLKDQDQGTVVISDHIGEKNVVLVFYPLDFTPV